MWIFDRIPAHVRQNLKERFIANALVYCTCFIVLQIVFKFIILLCGTISETLMQAMTFSLFIVLNSLIIFGSAVFFLLSMIETFKKLSKKYLWKDEED